MIDYLVVIADRALRIWPAGITLVAPVIAYVFTLAAGTGHIIYALLPVIAEVSRNAGVRPERYLRELTETEFIRRHQCGVRTLAAFEKSEYAEDWQDRLLDAPNHVGNWGLVQLISLSDDNQLREWLVGSGP